MGWKVDNSTMKKSGTPKKAEIDTFNEWAQLIVGGKDPKTAASKVADCDYEVLKGAPATMQVKGKPKEKPYDVKCCSIRLTQSNRVYFVQVDKLQIAKILKMGDHTPPTWPKEM